MARLTYKQQVQGASSRALLDALPEIWRKVFGLKEQTKYLNEDYRRQRSELRSLVRCARMIEEELTYRKIPWKRGQLFDDATILNDMGVQKYRR